MLFETLSGLRNFVHAARQQAKIEAQEGNRCIFSRGTFLCTSGKGNEQCNPNIEAECPTWDGNWKSVVALVEKVKAEYPGVEEVYISGGYDGAESPFAYREGNYDPWVSSWVVTVWKKEENKVASTPAVV